MPIAGDTFVSLLLGFSITWIIASQLAIQDIVNGSPFKIESAPTLESIGSFSRKIALRQTPILVPVQLKDMEEPPSEKFLERLFKIVTLGFGIGLTLAVFFTPIYILVGQFWIKDTWTYTSLLIFKCSWGVPIGVISQGGALYTAAAFANSNKSDSPVAESARVASGV